MVDRGTRKFESLCYIFVRGLMLNRDTVVWATVKEDVMMNFVDNVMKGLLVPWIQPYWIERSNVVFNLMMTTRRFDHGEAPSL